MLPRTHRLIALLPAARSSRKFIKKNHISLSLLRPPPLSQRFCGSSVLDANVHPIRRLSLGRVVRVACSLPSRAFVLVVLASPVACAAKADPSPVLVAAVVVVVLARAAGAGC
jgi:hypothetical protein